MDNDLVVKASAYGLTEAFWPPGEGSGRLGVLGQARFVARKRLSRLVLARPNAEALVDLETFLSSAVELEPTEEELIRAAELEASAAARGIAGLDTGESQLAAMAIERGMSRLETGDKRAIAAFDALLAQIAWLAALVGQVRCLEQIVWSALVRLGDPVWDAICAEIHVDKALAFACGCLSTPPPEAGEIFKGLQSYIDSVRRSAPRILSAGEDLTEEDGEGLHHAGHEPDLGAPLDGGPG